jgi:outer membrane protein assembly factor BamD
LLPVLTGCGSKDETVSQSGPVAPVEDLYNNGIDALNARRFSSATDQFNLVEQNYPYSSWAVNAQLMQGYTQYLQNHYTDAIGTLDRFINYIRHIGTSPTPITCGRFAITSRSPISNATSGAPIWR